jgi:hypothetical protein
MSDLNFRTSFVVDQSPAEVFAAVTNVRGWWSQEIEGGTERLGDEFSYHYKDIHRTKMRLTEVVAGRKVVWLVLENYFDFIEDQAEWTGTEFTFEVVSKDGRTEVRFTHLGLVPEYECYDVCSNAWGSYINGSLRSLITTGEGRPNLKEEAVV